MKYFSWNQPKGILLTGKCVGCLYLVAVVGTCLHVLLFTFWRLVHKPSDLMHLGKTSA